MNRGWILFLAVVGVATLAAYVLRDALQTEPEPSLPAPQPSAVEVVERVEPPPPLPPARRELAVRGRLLGPALEPLAGRTVACGEEVTVTDAEGVFAFPAAARPRRVTVRVFRDGQDVASWDGVIAGDPEPEAAAGPGDAPGAPEDEFPMSAAAYSLDGAMVPERPEGLRWTLNVAPGAAAPTSGGAPIRIEQAFVEEWGNGARVRLRGWAALPVGAHVAASIYFDGFRFLASVEPAEVNGGAFQASIFCPRDVKLFSGTYLAKASFNTLLERPSTVEEWERLRPEVDWDALVVPEVERRIFAGDPAEDRAADAASREYYASKVASVRELERALKSRVQELKMFARTKGDAAAREEKRASRGGFRHEDLLAAEGGLDEAKWRAFLDTEWRPKVQALRDEHGARGQEKYQEASGRLGGLLKSLLDVSYVYSRFQVYPAFGLEPHESDFYPDEEEAGDLIRLENNIRDNFLGLARYTQ
ncbi:MAG: hypothetical protein HY721_06690 [Planctomycetes bacterium]|nr:hypothetical protein [Planctomycetota bacterium]